MYQFLLYQHQQNQQLQPEEKEKKEEGEDIEKEEEEYKQIIFELVIQVYCKLLLIIIQCHNIFEDIMQQIFIHIYKIRICKSKM